MICKSTQESVTHLETLEAQVTEFYEQQPKEVRKIHSLIAVTYEETLKKTAGAAR